MAQDGDVQIPEGVAYKKTDEATNLRAKSLLLQELTKPEYTLFDKYIYCGPNLWDKFQKLPIKKGNILFQVPQADGSVLQKKGKLIQTNEDYKIFWDHLVAELKKENITIRKIGKEELKYFWGIIFYDIVEPIFVVECNKTKIIIDLDGKYKIIMIEAI